jgi:hypothetical protein
MAGLAVRHRAAKMLDDVRRNALEVLTMAASENWLAIEPGDKLREGDHSGDRNHAFRALPLAVL